MSEGTAPTSASAALMRWAASLAALWLPRRLWAATARRHVPDDWMVDNDSGRLKRADELSEITDRYLYNPGHRPVIFSGKWRGMFGAIWQAVSGTPGRLG